MNLQDPTLAARIATVLTAFGRDSSEPQADSTLASRLQLWTERVLEWNQRIDLTAARSHDELVDLLLCDAAALARTLGAERTGRTWVDVGSGAGAPGLALSLLLPECRVTLVEPKAKRVAFLRTVLGELGRADVQVLRCRAEDAPTGFSDAVSRATLPPAEWLEAGARLARDWVWVLLAQGEAPALAGFRVERELAYQWPLTGAARRLLGYRRTA